MSWRRARRRSNLSPWDCRLLRFARNDMGVVPSNDPASALDHWQLGLADGERGVYNETAVGVLSYSSGGLTRFSLKRQRGFLCSSL